MWAGGRWVTTALVGAAALFVVTACSHPSSSNAGPATVTTTVTALPTDTSIAVPSASDSSGSSDGSSGASPTDSSGASPTDSTTGPVVIGPGRQGSILTLADFFSPSSDWNEGSFDVAGRNGIQGIMAKIGGCASFETQDLELRLADRYKTLTFQAGQANDSLQGDQTLVVDVKANDRQVLTYKIPFNRIQSFTIPVTAVNSLVISFHLDDGTSNCRGSINAVIFQPMLA
jgi:hypothetical protein